MMSSGEAGSIREVTTGITLIDPDLLGISPQKQDVCEAHHHHYCLAHPVNPVTG